MKPKSPHKVFHELADGIIVKNMLSCAATGHPFKGNNDRGKGKVGEVIQNLSSEDREALKRLTSDDAANIRLF